ncbi:MAG: hypothetical protein WCL00_05485 [Bacteroidota bacterium]
MKNNTGTILTLIAAFILLGFGLIYLLKTSFMPYHGAALSLQWDETPAPLQFLILALMRAVAGGFLASAFAIFYLQYQFYKQNTAWIPLLILCIGTIVMLGSLYAEFIVTDHTPGHPPITFTLVGELFLVTGYLFNQADTKKD